MVEPAIRIRGLGKQYRIGERFEAYRTLRSSLSSLALSPFRWLRSRGRRRERLLIWALRDLSLDVEHGTVTGIIGRNGAGKTTLLRLLSRITEPTEGRIELWGRVGSLLEVGTGFHPELTGRENIFLNGAILGMRKTEIERKFEEIVDFAEVERFIDTPVKRYSSGMYVRLAFAVAAHLEPEILLVDEVLAVGDAEFQKKCLGKMGEVGREGRTVLFVSHNMTAIKSLCRRAVLLQDGALVAEGDAIAVVKEYQAQAWADAAAERRWEDPASAPRNDVAALRGVAVRDHEGVISADLDSRRSFTVEVDYDCLIDGAEMGVSLLVHNEAGECILSSISNRDPEWHGKSRRRGSYRSVCQVPGNLFPDGRLYLSVLVWGDSYSWSVREDDALSIHVHEVEGGVRGDFLKSMDGVIRPLLPWSTGPLGAGAGSGERGKRT